MAYIRAACTMILSSVIILIIAGIVDGQEQKLQSAKAWFDKGMLLREAGDPRSADAFKQASRDLDVYIGANGNDLQALTRAYTLRARCWNLLGDNEQAIRDLNKAIGLSPGDGDLYYLRAFIHELMGQTRVSIDDLTMSARCGNEKARDELKRKGMQW